MKFGVRLLEYLGNAGRLVELARLADRLGFDSCFFPNDTFMRNGIATSIAAAMATEKILIGIGFRPNTIDLSEIVTMIPTVDELSKGRGIYSIGAHTYEMMRWCGIGASNLDAVLRESVAIIRGMLQGEVVAFNGQIYHWTKECYLRFKPYRGDVPIYLTPFTPRLLRLSGEIADGSIPMAAPPESLGDIVALIKEGAKTTGKDFSGFDVVACCWLSVDRDRDKAKEATRKWISYFGPYLEEANLSKVGVCESDFGPIEAELKNRNYDAAARLVTDRMLRLAIAGTPDDCIESIELMERMGATHVSLGGPIGPDVEQAMSLLAEHIVPYFRDRDRS